MPAQRPCTLLASSAWDNKRVNLASCLKTGSGCKEPCNSGARRHTNTNSCCGGGAKEFAALPLRLSRGLSLEAVNAAVSALGHVVAARREQGAAPEAAGETPFAVCEALYACACGEWLASLHTRDSASRLCDWTAPVAG